MEHRLTFRDDDEALAILGRNDENLRLIRETLQPKIIVRGHDLVIIGQEQKEVDASAKLIEDLIAIYRSGHYLQTPEIKYALRTVKEDKRVDLVAVFSQTLSVSQGGRLIRPRTLGQKTYVEAIRDNDIVFGIGPAGTGKTYLAVACAISSLLKKEITRIVLVRPAVEAGERLGFLPGDLQEKVNPYLRPLYDAIYDMMGIEKFGQLLSQGIIEIAPLAFMRGRTLNDAFIILDEAQNTTPEQMMMFLTRLGFDSKAVVTGDITQIDLPNSAISGLVQVQEVLLGIEGISFVYFEKRDVVRHKLVQQIVKAYEDYGQRKEISCKDAKGAKR